MPKAVIVSIVFSCSRFQHGRWANENFIGQPNCLCISSESSTASNALFYSGLSGRFHLVGSEPLYTSGRFCSAVHSNLLTAVTSND